MARRGLCISVPPMYLEPSTRVPGSEPPRLPTAHRQIKAATADAQARVDHLIAAGGPWSRRRYEAFLRAMHAVIAAQAPSLRAHFTSLRLDLLETAADRLAHDLLSAGGSVPPACRFAPPVDDEAAAFGAAYVVLGGQLGGPVIGRALREQLCLRTDHLTYLEPAAAGVEWRAFVTALERWRVRATAQQWARTVGTAIATLAAMESALIAEGVS